MKFKIYILAFLFSVVGSKISHAQNQGINNLWLMGYDSNFGLPWGNTCIDFYQGYPDMTYFVLPMEFYHTHTNISDVQGNLLFYTNGVYIADASHDTMQNGSGLNPSIYTDSHQEGLLIPQAALILKKPGNNSIYYLFHNSLDSFPYYYPYHLYMTTIDMAGNNGLGVVTQKNYPLINDTLNPGKITATKHANGRDWWIICHKANSNKFYKLLLTPYGLPTITTQDIGTVRTSDAGQAKFSANGNWYAYYFFTEGLDIFNFDRCTGLLIDEHHDLLPSSSGFNLGCEFSPYSDMLYVTNVTEVYQYSMGVPDIIASRQLVATYDGFYDSLWVGGLFGTGLCLPQLAPDGRIYITTGNSTRYFHTIQYPYLPGTACNLIHHDLNLPAVCANTIPNHPNYFLGPLTGSACDTLTGLENENVPELIIAARPNPVIDDCTFSFPVHSGEGALQVFDLLGSKVYEEPIAPWSQFKRVSFKELPKGMYLCRMSWGDKSATVKVMRE